MLVPLAALSLLVTSAVLLIIGFNAGQSFGQWLDAHCGQLGSVSAPATRYAQVALLTALGALVLASLAVAKDRTRAIGILIIVAASILALGSLFELVSVSLDPLNCGGA